MMKDFFKQTTITANSTIGGVVAVGMRAMLNEDGKWSIAKNVKNTEAYLQNKEECDADFSAFEEEVLKLAQE